MFEKEVNSLLRNIEKKQPSKKRINPSWSSISNFFSIKDTFKKENVSKKNKLKNLGLLIVKNNLPIQFVESIWLKHLILHLCPKLNFPSRRQFSQDILPRLVEKVNWLYVLLTLTKCYSTIASFNL
jgi:hypothetical protein